MNKPIAPEDIFMLPGDSLTITEIEAPFEIKASNPWHLRISGTIRAEKFVVIDAAQYRDLQLCQQYLSRSWWTRLRRRAQIAANQKGER